jgi:hypothetical protein
VGTIEAISEELTGDGLVALLGEEYDARAKRLVGIMPQGLGHPALVNRVRLPN